MSAASVKQMIEEGADVNQKDAEDYTPLMRALGRRKIIEMLLNHGADINARNMRNINGATVLDLALRSVQKLPEGVNTVRFLLDCGVDPNIRGWLGLSAMHRAVSYIYPVCVLEMLLDHGGNPNLKNRFGETSLHLAVAERSYAKVKLLLEHGADPMLKTDKGETALDIAKRGGEEQIAELIQKWLRKKQASGASPR